MGFGSDAIIELCNYLVLWDMKVKIGGNRNVKKWKIKKFSDPKSKFYTVFGKNKGEEREENG